MSSTVLNDFFFVQIVFNTLSIHIFFVYSAAFFIHSVVNIILCISTVNESESENQGGVEKKKMCVCGDRITNNVSYQSSTTYTMYDVGNIYIYSSCR